MAQSKPVKGTQSYVFFVQEMLGRGAMGAVYIARHRKKGTKHAAKVFNPDPKYAEYILRETEMLRTMSPHRNIVALAAIEEETYSKDKVIIMELCDAGSLQNILDDPKNHHGLPQDEFLLVFKHTYRALHHLYDSKIIHRDIKPGNILLQITSDGSHVYKLTDFGAAKKLNDDDEGFKSICGTEEYLHPGLHSSAFIRRIPGVLFGHNVDLWSFGVTIYQCATGKLPFRPRDGVRHDKHMMNDLMTKKKPRVISRYQTPDGNIVNETELPQTAKLFRGTRHFIADVLSRLFDIDHPWAANNFFGEMSDFCDRIEIYAYSFEIRDFVTLFMKKSHCLIHLKEEISKFTPTVSSNQLLFTKDGPLESVITSQDQIVNYPETSIDDPIYVIGENFTHPESSHKTELPSLPAATSGLSPLSSDAKWATEVCGNIYHFLYITSISSLVQCHLFFLRTVIKENITRIFGNMEHFVWHQREVQRYHSDLWKQTVHHIHTHHRNAQTSPHLQKALARLNKKVEKCKADQNRLQSQFEELQERLGRYTAITKRGMKPSCVAPDRCKQKGEIIIKSALPMHKAILDDKQQHDLPHNDMEIHKYNKSELKRTHRKFQDYLVNHCLLQTELLYQETDDIIRDMLEARSAMKQLETRIASFGEYQTQCGVDILEIVKLDKTDSNGHGATKDHSFNSDSDSKSARAASSVKSDRSVLRNPGTPDKSSWSLVNGDATLLDRSQPNSEHDKPTKLIRGSKMKTPPSAANNTSSYFNHLMSQQTDSWNGLYLPDGTSNMLPSSASNWSAKDWQSSEPPSANNPDGHSKYRTRSAPDDVRDPSTVTTHLDRSETLHNHVDERSIFENDKDVPSGS